MELGLKWSLAVLLRESSYVFFRFGSCCGFGWRSVDHPESRDQRSSRRPPHSPRPTARCKALPPSHTSFMQISTSTMRREAELELPRLPLRASAASMPRLTFTVERVTSCPAAEASAPLQPSDAVQATAAKPAKPKVSRWQRLPPAEHHQQLVGRREVSPVAGQRFLRKAHSSDVLQLPSIIRPPRRSNPPVVQPLRSSMHPLIRGSPVPPSPALPSVVVDNLRGSPGYPNPNPNP